MVLHSFVLTLFFGAMFANRSTVTSCCSDGFCVVVKRVSSCRDIMIVWLSCRTFWSGLYCGCTTFIVSDRLPKRFLAVTELYEGFAVTALKFVDSPESVLGIVVRGGGLVVVFMLLGIIRFMCVSFSCLTSDESCMFVSLMFFISEESCLIASTNYCRTVLKTSISVDSNRVSVSSTILSISNRLRFFLRLLWSVSSGITAKFRFFVIARSHIRQCQRVVKQLVAIIYCVIPRVWFQKNVGSRICIHCWCNGIFGIMDQTLVGNRKHTLLRNTLFSKLIFKTR